MKYRMGFVSNSSSASFVLDKRYLTPEQQEMIREFCRTDESDFGVPDEDEDFMRGWTAMDNGYLFSFIKDKINPPIRAIVVWK